MRRVAWAALGLLLAVPALGAPVAQSTPSPPGTAGFSGLIADLEILREILGIPGLSAAVIEDQRLVWAAGFGYADVDDRIEASPSTPYGLASVTKPIAATLVMQLVEEGAIDLDSPTAAYGVSLPDDSGVTVRHLLNHTSEHGPGLRHVYNGNRYGYLAGVIGEATGRSFAAELGDRILVPLGMGDSALNPLDSWGERGLRGLDALLRGVGLGDAFDSFPDVYSRLARPYQFDTDYSTIAGMYHLHHNPAAGMISSVEDLAAFDIALDEGSLLGDVAVNEMFGATVPTQTGQTTKQYGLGWYVQDYDGVRLLWHTGRWPPSTSALYLKVPDLGLTFIALANTDNLTVPFAGIGEGDVMRSALALTFFRHVVFAAQGAEPPPFVDWTADAATIMDQVDAATNPTARSHLERELWAYRQAMASSGNQSQPGVLASVARQKFQGSELRSDPSFTWLPGSPQVVAPIMGARSFTAMSRIVLAWIVLVVLAALTMAGLLARSERSGFADWAGWLLATLVLGPLAVAAFVFSARGSPTAQVTCAAALCMTGYAVAWVGAVAILFGTTGDPNPLTTIGALVVLPIGFGLLVIRTPRLSRAGSTGFWRAARRGLFSEVTTAIVGVAALLSVTIYVDNRLASVVPYPTSPYFWAMLAVGSTVGLVAMLPVHYVMLLRGFTIWPEPGDGITSVRLPTLRNSWLMLVATVAITAATVVVFVGGFA